MRSWWVVVRRARSWPPVWSSLAAACWCWKLGPTTDRSAVSAGPAICWTPPRSPRATIGGTGRMRSLRDGTCRTSEPASSVGALRTMAAPRRGVIEPTTTGGRSGVSWDGRRTISLRGSRRRHNACGCGGSATRRWRRCIGPSSKRAPSWDCRRSTTSSRSMARRRSAWNRRTAPKACDGTRPSPIWTRFGGIRASRSPAVSWCTGS